ncbi:MAG TPA: serine hydrolase domain-containing protein [Longimicrobiales bacterium]|nr:serine hydrolase domain-containing protein [Longimicrobiales bacterium]
MTNQDTPDNPTRRRQRRITRRRPAIFACAAVLLAAILAGACEPLYEDGDPTLSLDAPPVVPTIPEPTAESMTAFVAAGVGSAYPGGALAVGTGARTEFVRAVGRIGWRDASPPVVVDSTLYDLASLTKAMATAVAVLLLVEDGRITLDEPVRRHLPEFEGVWKDSVTWRHLLTHTSGLPPGIVIRGTSPADRLRRLLLTRVQVPPGRRVTYSDVGYVVLWAAAQRVAGEPLERMLERRVWQPLGMHSTQFAPGRGCETCAPTLRLRTGEPFRGLPSDELARALGSVTGNAGLFATVGDVGRFAAMVAAGGELDGVRVLSPASVRGLLAQQPGAGRRTLGWTAICPDEEPDASEPCQRPVAFGHNGWTGTSLWLDPASGRWAVVLTNRSYERPNRPFPLDGLRRDLFLHVARAEAEREPTDWVARTAGGGAPQGSLGEVTDQP